MANKPTVKRDSKGRFQKLPTLQERFDAEFPNGIENEYEYDRAYHTTPAPKQKSRWMVCLVYIAIVAVGALSYAWAASNR